MELLSSKSLIFPLHNMILLLLVSHYSYMQSQYSYITDRYNSGYKQNIRFQHNVFAEAQKRKSNRGRKIIWFNPPYSCSVATDMGKKFFLLLDKHFPKTHKFYKIFNRNNVKVSYSSMPKISSIIKSHNKKVLSNDESKSSKSSCNC